MSTTRPNTSNSFRPWSSHTDLTNFSQTSGTKLRVSSSPLVNEVDLDEASPTEPSPYLEQLNSFKEKVEQIVAQTSGQGPGNSALDLLVSKENELLLQEVRDVYLKLEERDKILEELKEQLESFTRGEEQADETTESIYPSRKPSTAVLEKEILDASDTDIRRKLIEANNLNSILQIRVERLQRQKEEADQDLADKEEQLAEVRGQLASVVDRSRTSIDGSLLVGSPKDKTQRELSNEIDDQNSDTLFRPTARQLQCLEQDVRLLRMERDAISEELEDRMQRQYSELMEEMKMRDDILESLKGRLEELGEKDLPELKRSFTDPLRRIAEEDEEEEVEEEEEEEGLKLLKKENQILRHYLGETVDTLEMAGVRLNNEWLQILDGVEPTRLPTTLEENSHNDGELEKLKHDVNQLLEECENYRNQLHEQQMEIDDLRYCNEQLERANAKAEETIRDLEAITKVAEDVQSVLREELVRKQREVEELKKTQQSTRANRRDLSINYRNEDTEAVLRQTHECCNFLKDHFQDILQTLESTKDGSFFVDRNEERCLFSFTVDWVNHFKEFSIASCNLMERHADTVTRVQDLVGSNSRLIPTSRHGARTMGVGAKISLYLDDILEMVNAGEILIQYVGGIISESVSWLSDFLEHMRLFQAKINVIDHHHHHQQQQYVRSDSRMSVYSERAKTTKNITRSANNSTSPNYNPRRSISLRSPVANNEREERLAGMFKGSNMSSPTRNNPLRIRRNNPSETENSDLMKNAWELEYQLKDSERQFNEKLQESEMELYSLKEYVVQVKRKYQDQQRLLAQEVRLLRAKLKREIGFREDLGFQKRYLLLLIGGLEVSEQATLKLIASGSSFSGDKHKLRFRPGETLRVAIYTVIAVIRMKKLRESWLKAKSSVKKAEAEPVAPDSPYSLSPVRSEYEDNRRLDDVRRKRYTYNGGGGGIGALRY